MDLDAIDRHLQQSQPNHLDRLKELLRIPSVSADPERLWIAKERVVWQLLSSV